MRKNNSEGSLHRRTFLILLCCIALVSGLEIRAQDTVIQLALTSGVRRTITVKGRGHDAVFSELYCLDGTVYKNVSVTSISDDTLGIMHEDGAGKIPWSALPKEIYGIVDYRQEEVDKRKAASAASIQQAKQREEQRIDNLYRPKEDAAAKQEFDNFKFNGFSSGKTTWKLIVVSVDNSEHRRAAAQMFKPDRKLFFSSTKVLCRLAGTQSCFVFLPTTFGSAKDSESDVATGEVIAVTGEPTFVEDEGYVRFYPDRIKRLGYLSE